MRELSLYTGIGGGLLATHHLLGWKTIGYVEINDYCQRVLAQRIRDRFLHNSPIFGDIRAFLDSGCAEIYRGITDVITAGFPCQPFSVAGKQLGENDPRNLWPETCECIRRIRPQFAFLENVRGLLASGYFGTLLSDLAEIGYDCRWTCLQAKDVRAPHKKRERLWILAADVNRLRGNAWRPEFAGLKRESASISNSGNVSDGAGVAYPHSDRCDTGSESAQWQTRTNVDRSDKGTGLDMDNTKGQRCQARGLSFRETAANTIACESGEDVSNSDRTGLSQREMFGENLAQKQSAFERSNITWWDRDPADEPGAIESEMVRVVHGSPDRVERIKALGNGQIPAMAAYAWNVLSQEF